MMERNDSMLARAKRPYFALFLLFIAFVITSGLFVLNRRAINENEQARVAVSVNSDLSANYQADELPTRPGVAVDLIFDVIQDTEPDADIEARRDSVINELLTPIPSVTPMFTYTPSSTPTNTPTATPTNTPTSTPSMTPTPTATATETPTPTVSATPPFGGVLIHEVVAGETLSHIALRYNTTVEMLLLLNPQLPEEVLSIGLELKVPIVMPTPTP